MFTRGYLHEPQKKLPVIGDFPGFRAADSSDSFAPPAPPLQGGSDMTRGPRRRRWRPRDEGRNVFQGNQR